MNIGVLGGTFDPIHMGHLIAAEEARITLNLDLILFIPAGQPWRKNDRDITPAGQRLEMVRRAIAGNPFFQLSTLETERPGDSYAVDTLELLRRSYGVAAGLFFIIGQDSLEQFPHWKNPGLVLTLCRLVVMNRPGVGSTDMTLLERQVPGITRGVIPVTMPDIGISATGIRERVARGQSIRYLVPAAVEEFIREEHLYEKGSSSKVS